MSNSVGRFENNESNAGSGSGNENNTNNNNTNNNNTNNNNNNNNNGAGNFAENSASSSNSEVLPSPALPAPAPEPAAPPQPEPTPSPNSVPGTPILPVDAADSLKANRLGQFLIHKYFSTNMNPMTKHHIDSFDQFLQRDLKNIIKSKNPMIILKNPKAKRGSSDNKYRIELYIGGLEGNDIQFGVPALTLKKGKDIRLLFPNEARLRNLTYAVPIEATIYARVSVRLDPTEEDPRPEPIVREITIPKVNLCNFPLMLHSQYCILNGKSDAMLREMGECPYDEGGYFIVDGSEKVLVTRQEGAFNTLWITPQPADEAVEYYCSLSSLNPISREVRRVNFYWTREKVTLSRGFNRVPRFQPSVLEVMLPYVLKPIPVMILFRALGVESDKAIVNLIFPDSNHPETKYLADLLIPCFTQAHPFFDTYSAIQYIKSLTKGFSESHVLDILHNQLFPHVEDKPGARVAYLADCVRKILRVVKKLDLPPSRDDTRYQRCLTSGFLCQMMFQNIYNHYLKRVSRSIDEMYNYNESTYTNMDFFKILEEPANQKTVLAYGFLTEGVMRAFKGKWMTGVNREEQGVIQQLDRLSYLNFISHLRHAVLDFDTSMKLPGPRRLNPSQYGYYCTSETPSGASIGITKNLTIMTSISTGMLPAPLVDWLLKRGTVIPSHFMTPQLQAVTIPVYLNAGLVGYTNNPELLTIVLKLLKRTGCLPPWSSSGFSIPERRIFIFVDDGRPLRPLICCHQRGKIPSLELFKGTWRQMVIGTLPATQHVELNSKDFLDPLQDKVSPTLEDYIELLAPHQGVIEYIDPSEQNEAFITNYPIPDLMLPETTHIEVHPSTILGLLGNCIPFPNHNQSPRNQLSASQSKQSLSVYATNFMNRFDNTANVICYGQVPLSRTLYLDYFGHDRLPYGQNVILAMGMYGGYNQEDGIIMNRDALERGQFRSLNFRSYEAREEDDPMSKMQIRIAHPKSIPAWLDLRANLDYSMLDDDGIVKVGSYVTPDTVICARYMITDTGKIADASVTPQVWTRGRVEKVVVTINNVGHRLVKIRVSQDRVPELGDKFSNRHGQKGTLNILYRGHDMPRTIDGITPDMIMNPTAIPSRMTIGQILEMIFGNVGARAAAYANTTAFMNDGSPHEMLGEILQNEFGLHKMSNQVLYNGMTGEMIEADIFMGVVYGMRLKHMTEDKWNARGAGRKEMRTHQPTGGRGNEGGLKIGEMDRDTIIAHGVSTFLQESMTKRSDGAEFIVCNGCGTLPLYNERESFYLCPMCDGPIEYAGDTVNTLQPIPPPVRSGTTFSKIEIPYASKLWIQEMETFANMSMRILTTHDTKRLYGLDSIEAITQDRINALLTQKLERVQIQTTVPDLEKKANVAPTAAQITDELERLQAEATAAFQEEAAAEAAASRPLAPELPQNTGTEAPAPQGSVVSLANAVAATAAPAAIELAPGSVAPVAAPTAGVPVTFNGQPLGLLVQPQEGLIMQTSEGVPVINVDTSEAALKAQGLREPGDSTVPIVAPAPLLDPSTQVRRKPRRTGIASAAPPPNAIAASLPPPVEQEGGSAQSGTPVTVIKLG